MEVHDIARARTKEGRPQWGEKRRPSSFGVTTMSDVHKELAVARTAHAKTAIHRQIDTTDRQLDRLVYDLYGLADDEIRIVEEATNA